MDGRKKQSSRRVEEEEEEEEASSRLSSKINRSNITTDSILCTRTRSEKRYVIYLHTHLTLGETKLPNLFIKNNPYSTKEFHSAKKTLTSVIKFITNFVQTNESFRRNVLVDGKDILDTRTVFLFENLEKTQIHGKPLKVKMKDWERHYINNTKEESIENQKVFQRILNGNSLRKRIIDGEERLILDVGLQFYKTPLRKQKKRKETPPTVSPKKARKRKKIARPNGDKYPPDILRIYIMMPVFTDMDGNAKSDNSSELKSFDVEFDKKFYESTVQVGMQVASTVEATNEQTDSSNVPTTTTSTSNNNENNNSENNNKIKQSILSYDIYIEEIRQMVSSTIFSDPSCLKAYNPQIYELVR